MQSVARYAFAEPPEIRERLVEDAALHGAVAGAVHRIMVEAGATCRPPTGAFYVYPDFAPLREPLAEQGITDGATLQHYLLEELGVAVLSGHHFGDRPEALRFRAATSMLYGDTPEQQRQTQTAADPLTVPHVADALVRIEQALAKLPR
jgi:aspartate aminotransferase